MARRYAGDSFYFPKALGDRLRELRKRAGLTQQELASLAGREFRGNQALISRLELGKYRSPALRTVADYLRACRASFRDLGDILDGYTSQPCVVEQ
jgi:transcriptional regulator with XRE-family HTH domain